MLSIKKPSRHLDEPPMLVQLDFAFVFDEKPDLRVISVLSQNQRLPPGSPLLERAPQCGQHAVQARLRGPAVVK